MPQAITELHIVTLFTRMQHLFGHRWTSNYGPAMENGRLSPAANQWYRDLRGYTAEQVSRGLDLVVHRRMDWPPGAIEFMGLCDGVPTLSEILDTQNDYGVLCEQIRSKMDFYQLDGMSSSDRRKVAAQRFEQAVQNLRGSGALALGSDASGYREALENTRA